VQFLDVIVKWLLDFPLFCIENIRNKKHWSIKTMARERKDGRPIYMKDFYSLLRHFNSYVCFDVRKFSTEINKLLDCLHSSRGSISLMQEEAGTQYLSDAELEIYENTYQTVYEIYDKLEKEIELIKQHQEKLYQLIRQLEDITANKY
jgi:hypothetical protein